MSRPNISIPTEFAINGDKTDFSQAKITNGFDRLQPDVLPGDNLNKFIDDTYKGLNGVLELYEGCVLYDSGTTYNNKSLVFDITNDGIKFYHSLQNGNINHALTDADYWEEVNLGGSSRNVGEIISSTLPLTDAGLHLLDGTLLQYGIYKEFIDYIADLYAENPSANYFTTEALWQQSVSTYGVCGKFVYDSVNNTVRLPKVTGIIEGTTDVTALGDLVEAGLPNITGSLTAGASTSADNAEFASGAFQGSAQGNDVISSGSYRLLLGWKTFDASRSSAIYGNSSTVQPQTIKCFIYIVIANSTKTNIQVDIDEIATDLNGKMDIDLTNMSASQSAKNTIISWAMPDYTSAISFTFNSSNSYTAPADGFICITANSNQDVYSDIKINNQLIGDTAVAYYTKLQYFFPVSKNDLVSTNYSNYSNAVFYPMKGAN